MTAEAAAKSGKIALLLPESKTARYESQDRPNFEKKAKELCPDCEIIYSNADQDAAKQQQQADAALTKGAKVLVLDPVDAASAGGIVARAKQKNVPVHQLRPPDHQGGRGLLHLVRQRAGGSSCRPQTLVEEAGRGRRQGRARSR